VFGAAVSRKVFAIFAGLSLACGACTVGPNYHPPEISVEGSYHGDAGAAGSSAGAWWWMTLRDPALNALEAQAAENNLDVRQAQARVREARAERAVATGASAPSVNVGGQYQHERFSQNAAPFNAFDVPNFPWEFNLYQVGFDASWELDVFGGTRRAIEAVNANLQASEEDGHAVLVTLQAEVARNYIELRGYQNQRQIVQHSLEGQQQTLDITRDRLKQGVGSQLDVARASALVADTAARIPTYEREEWQSIHRLAILTNEPLEKLLTLRQTAAIPAAPDGVLVGVPAELLRRRPDIRRAERQLASATARIGVAEAELYPKFSITGFFNLQSASVEDLLAWKSRAMSLGPTVSWPIFEAGRLRGVVAVRNAQQEQALLGYEQVVQNAIGEVRDEMIAFSTERQRHGSLTDAVRSNQEALDLAQQLYGQGLIDFLSVLDSQRQLFQAQESLSENDTQTVAAVVALYKALGGGWETGQPAGASTSAGAATQPTTAPVQTAPASRSTLP